MSTMKLGYPGLGAPVMRDSHVWHAGKMQEMTSEFLAPLGWPKTSSICTSE